MGEVLGSIAVVAVIVGFSAWITALISGRMYLKCAACRTLNAHRRVHCRACGLALRPEEEESVGDG